MFFLWSLFTTLQKTSKRWGTKDQNQELERSELIKSMLIEKPLKITNRGIKSKWIGIDNHTVDYNADIAICFTGDTFVYTKEGNRPIKDIKIGDDVFSENPETGEKDLKKVKNIFVHETNMILHVVVGNENIKTTETHPFWVVGKGWTSAGKLKQGDRLLIYSGEYLTVTNVKIEVLNNPIKVYNFEVEGWHTYFISISNILVHNTCSFFVPNNSGWTPAGTNMTTWISQNG